MSLVRFNNSYVQSKYGAATDIAVTGAAGTVTGGPTIPQVLVGEALAARVLLHPGTTSITFVGLWQVLDDNGSSWINCVKLDTAALTWLTTAGNAWATAAGGAVTLYAECPQFIRAGNRSARFAVQNEGATGVGGTTDYFNCEYDFRSPVNMYGV